MVKWHIFHSRQQLFKQLQHNAHIITEITLVASDRQCCQQRRSPFRRRRESACWDWNSSTAAETDSPGFCINNNSIIHTGTPSVTTYLSGPVSWHTAEECADSPVSELISSAWMIVGHFRHSSNAVSHVHDIQDLGLSKQVVVTNRSPALSYDCHSQWHILGQQNLSRRWQYEDTRISQSQQWTVQQDKSVTLLIRDTVFLNLYWQWQNVEIRQFASENSLYRWLFSNYSYLYSDE